VPAVKDGYKRVEVHLPDDVIDYLNARRRLKGPMNRQIAELVEELRDREQGDAPEPIRPARAG
jgi:hypothetical protein